MAWDKSGWLDVIGTDSSKQIISAGGSDTGDIDCNAANKYISLAIKVVIVYGNAADADTTINVYSVDADNANEVDTIPMYSQLVNHIVDSEEIITVPSLDVSAIDTVRVEIINNNSAQDVDVWVSAQAGYSEPRGLSGYSGYSGTGGDGASGYSGYSGAGGSGYSGSSGYSGDNPGSSGYSGASGYSGSGVSGYSGVGLSGYSGAGYSGYSGFSGIGGSGYSGFSGDNPGSSGYSGISGFSGIGIAGNLGIANTTSRYTVETTTGLGVWITSISRQYIKLSWSRSGTVLTINQTAHSRSIGDRVILRNTNEEYLNAIVSGIATNTFTVQCNNIGTLSGDDASYTLGCKFIYDNVFGSVSLGTVSVPVDGNVVMLSMRVHLTSGSRAGTTFDVKVPNSAINGAGNNTNDDNLYWPAYSVRQDGDSMIGVSATIAKNAESDYSRFRFGALGTPSVGILIALTW